MAEYDFEALVKPLMSGQNGIKAGAFLEEPGIENWNKKSPGMGRFFILEQGS